MRLIDADALKRKITMVTKQYNPNAIMERPAILLEDVDEAPTIDAEPIVRCKDCKFNYANQIPSGDECQLCVELPISKDFFCAYGERMEIEE